MTTGDSEVARFYATIDADIRGLTQGISQARAQLAGLSGGVQGHATTMNRAFASITQGLGFGLGFGGLSAITRGLSDVVKGAMSYETAFTGVRRTVEATEKQYASLDATIRQMSTSTLPVNRDVLANIAAIGGQMGVGIEGMPNFIDTIARTSVAAPALSPDAAAMGLGRLSNLLDLPTTQIDELSSAILATGDATLATEPEILEFAQRIAGAGKVAGFSNAEILGWAAALPSVGINAEAGGTALSQAIIKITKMVAEGGDELKLLGALSGESATQFADAWRTNPGEAFRSFIGSFQSLGTEGTVAILDALGLDAARMTDMFLRAGSPKALGILDQATGIDEEQLRTGTYLLEESAKAFGTSASQVEFFKNNIRDVVDEISGPLIETMNTVMPLVSGWLQENREQIGAVASGAVEAVASTSEAIAELISSAPFMFAINVVSSWDENTGRILALIGAGGIGAALGGPVGAAIGLGGAAGVQAGNDIQDKLHPQDWFETGQGILGLGRGGGNWFGLGGQTPAEREAEKAAHAAAEGSIGPGDLGARRALVDLPEGMTGDADMGIGGTAAGWKPTKAEDPELAASRARAKALADQMNASDKEKTPKLTDLEKALKQIEEKHTSELVEAYIKGGDKRVATVRAEQAKLDGLWGGIATALHDNLGVKVPEEFRLMWEAAQKETKDKGKDTLSGLLGFLAARDTEHGANPLSNRFRLGDNEDGKGMLGGGGGPTYVVQGDVNVGLRPDIPGGVDVNAAITVADRVDYTQVR